MNVLVGSTGFVGSNLYAAGRFGEACHSTDIEKAYGTAPDLLVYAGLRAEKYLANNAPEKDRELISQAEENISRITPKKLVLISTIDVFKVPCYVDENSAIDTEGLHPYGYDRYLLEQWVREHYPDALIVRLPGLYGKNLKKNFIYDLIDPIPTMLKEEKMEELSAVDSDLRVYYTLQSNGFYKVKGLDGQKKKDLRDRFRNLGFSSLSFTDSRSVFQFYPLKRLWDDILTALENDIRIWHPATEPISAAELYHYLTGEVFRNELDGRPAHYDYRTIYAEVFGGSEDYICDKDEIMRDIREFVSSGITPW